MNEINQLKLNNLYYLQWCNSREYIGRERYKFNNNVAIKFKLLILNLLIFWVSNYALAQGSGNLYSTIQASVSLDKPDYLPGETANISGKDFQSSELVTLQVLHADGTPSTGEDHEPWTVQADNNGNIQTAWHVCEDDCKGSVLRLTALGQTSGLTAIANFTDATNFIYVGSFKVGDGPCWHSPTPPTYTAREAAALLFGGSPNDYAISVNSSTTDETSITHTAWVDGYGDVTYLNTPASEDFKQGSTYDYPAFSAFVKDHSDGTNDLARTTCNYTGYPVYVNYVWRINPQSISVSFETSTLCTGQNIFVDYTVTGTFNANNTFTAQLSNASGSFASPTTIGTLAGTASGSINATIPANTLAGTGYRIRVVSSDPSVTGSDNENDITINTTPEVSVPTIAAVNNDVGLCGAAVSFAATATGTPAPTITYAIGSTPITSPYTFPVGTTTVTATATNSCSSDSETFTVTVTNTAPVLSSIIPGTVSPVPINTAFSASAPFTDNNLQSATWNWDDGTTSVGTIGAATVTGSRTYNATGVYTIGLNVKDACNSTASSTYQYVVVYDPSGGFVTGGGWITSPQNSQLYYMQESGRANFGFVSKYVKGATKPTGETNFEFQTANLHFQSSSYEWLVVSGATARYKGVGTINGSGSYGFILSAIDGQVTGGGGYDKFRIKIWDKNNNDVVVYDNNLSATSDDALAETIISGGSIVVHEAKKTTSSKTLVAVAEPQGSSFYSYPTAFSDKTTIAFSLEKNENYVLEVFDLKGALVKKLASGTAEANKLYEIELNGNGMMEGVYITRLTTASNVRSLKAVLKR